MHQTEIKHPKQDFQVERIAFFSDAVFAIALTLLVLEFKPPVITSTTTPDEIWGELGEMKWKLVAFLLSFFLIANYWIRHHTLFKHVHNYNKNIIRSNMFMLLPIIFFPFTAAFLYESLSSDNNLIIIPFRLFIFNNILAGATTYFFYWVVMIRFKEMSYPMEKEESAEFEEKLLLTIIVFVIVIVLSFFTFKYCWTGVLPEPLFNLYRKFFKKKNTLKIKDAQQKNSAANT
jgi:uncharacterized membrane protein